MEEEVYEEKDDSRPFFQRQKCEVGVYISVYEAKAFDEKSIGLEHFFRMRTTELLHDYFCNRDRVDIRAKLVEWNTLDEMYIERFEPGIVMAVGFDNVAALDDLWHYHNEGKLNPLMHDLLITSGALKAADVTGVTLVTKLWDDEYISCKDELEKRSHKIQEIACRPLDIKLIKRLKKYQTFLGPEVSIMRDLENEMDLNRNEFMNCVRNLLPDDRECIRSIAEYEKLATSSRARKMYHKDLLDLYLTIIQKWRDYYHTFEREVVTPFMQLHSVCENEKQKTVKAKIINHIRGMQSMLKPDTELLGIAHPEMEKKITRRESPVFLGLLSLVPIGVERVSDVDIMIDEYTREHKMEFKLHA